MSQPAKQVNMREAMPRTAKWVAEMRERHGAQYIDRCIRAALAGERNQFYAVEGGHVVGTPFDWSETLRFLVTMSIVSGGPYVAAMRDPAGDVDLVVVPPAATNGGANGPH
ncbi:hypothetical protein GT347_16005 [Xylophilus rhododendri]|uniref:Uncharacterized protein n=1 Tax=Xylophilus rhododendri TaxID=2697032 RepID=A0A857J9D9_9BURK|nr:hypothetical protein [Xylophilus rhododendri]QHI99348.1 hypothetical protein GT347_16005 [Xylophilus rhododendri]